MKTQHDRLDDLIGKFYFRDIHENVFLGTASDRYAGWLGQIYSPELYRGKITRRTKQVGGQRLVEEILPIESVGEYFEHFRVLELDFTFYGLLLDENERPTRIFRTLLEYKANMNNSGELILKVPQVIFARKLMRKGDFVENEEYLNVDTFVKRFYGPAREILGRNLRGVIFEQEYQKKSYRVPPGELASELDHFFGNIPEDDGYHVELRTRDYLCKPVFRVLEKYGIGQVLSHWTWLPRLKVQFRASGERFFNSGKNAVIRLMTPRGIRYEEAYVKAHPFDKIVEGMINSDMIDDTVEIMKKAIDEGFDANVIVNNRAGGNAPMIAQMIARKFLDTN